MTDQAPDELEDRPRAADDTRVPPVDGNLPSRQDENLDSEAETEAGTEP